MRINDLFNVDEEEEDEDEEEEEERETIFQETDFKLDEFLQRCDNGEIVKCFRSIDSFTYKSFNQFFNIFDNLFLNINYFS